MRRAPRIRTAQLPAQSNEDYLVETTRGVAVLDGATSHTRSVGPTGGEYARSLGLSLADMLGDEYLAQPLTFILEQAIERTARELRLDSTSQSEE